MISRKLIGLVRRNVARNRRHFVLSSVGIVVGIASLAFFLALGAGVRAVVLGDIFPIDRMEIEPPRSDLEGGGLLGGLLPAGAGRRLDDGVVAALRARPEVAQAYPKMKLAFPSRGWGGKAIVGRDFYFEVSGLADGIEPALVAGELDGPLAFRDYEADGGSSHRACFNDGMCAAPEYCAWDVHQCQRPVPVLLSRYLVELYNGSIAPAHGLPRIGAFMASRFRGLTFTIELGRSFLGDVARRGSPVQRRLQLVGISDKAVPMGLTVPIGYVRRWNGEYAAPEASAAYTSVVLRVRSKRDITALAAIVKGLGFEPAESQAEQVGLFITLVTALLAFISFTIVGVSALNITHTFLMVIAERRREIGVLRAVGATRGDVRALILGEAAAIGLVGGAVGLAVAMGAARAVDLVSARWLPDFPFKPDSYFAFSWPLGLGAVGFAILFCILGALGPASRAARMEPAQALSAP